MILRLLNGQGIAGLAAALCLVALLVIQKGDTRHWRKQSIQYEMLYRGEQVAFARTVANYRAAADAARAADKASAERVRAEQQAINERTSNAFKLRLADARTRAQRLRVEAPSGAADPSAGGTTPVSGLSLTAAGTPPGTAEDRLSRSDRLIATEQAIQLDELIKWVGAQASVDQHQRTRQ